MRIKLEFVTKYKIDHEFYGVELTDIFSKNKEDTEFYYRVFYWEKVPEIIGELLKSDIVIRMQKEIQGEKPFSDIEMRIKKQVINSLIIK